MMIQWVTPYQNNRINYVAQIISDRWGIPFVPVKDFDINKPTVYYGNANTSSSININESGYLEEGRSIENLQEKNGRLLINGVDDIFAAILFLLANNEFLLIKQRDQHGRLLCDYSQLSSKFYMKPYVDIVIEDLKTKLISTFNIPLSVFKKHCFKIQPTFDIDVAYAYGNRPFWRSLGGRMKDLFKGLNDRIEERKKVLKGDQKDPFDTYENIIKMAKDFDVKVFFLVGKYGKYDKNLSPNTEVMKGLIRKMDQYAVVGVHPSYGAKDVGILKEELNTLENITGQPVKYSRQHFLKLKLPDTYRMLVQAGIEHDFTMGFADHPGFRAGTCFSYTFYDIEKDTPIPLTVHPFIYMDGTLKDYMHLSPERAQEVIIQLKKEVKKVNGVFSFLWHNDTINDIGDWKGWRKVLEITLEKD